MGYEGEICSSDSLVDRLEVPSDCYIYIYIERLSWWIFGGRRRLAEVGTGAEPCGASSRHQKCWQVLRRICEEPEDFSFRSLNLVDDEYRENLGSDEEAQQFLEELGRG